MSAFFNMGFSVREPMWHGLGEVLDEYPGREDAMRIAGHDFLIVERPFVVLGKERASDSFPKDASFACVPGEDGPQFHGVKSADGWKALINSKNGDLLNVVKDSYGVVQNETLWDIVDTIVDQPNVKYETAGILRDGAVLWVLAYLDEPTTIKGDDSPIYPFVLVSSTHDGSGACKAQATSVRVVCWNTYSAAGSESKRTGREFTFRHTKKVMDRIADAKEALQGARVAHDDFLALANELATLPASKTVRELFLSAFIPMPEEALISDRVKRNVEEARATVRETVLASNTIPEAHRETGYGLFMAGTEYMDHLRRAHTSETRFGRSMLRQESAKSKLASLIRETVAEVA